MQIHTTVVYICVSMEDQTEYSSGAQLRVYRHSYLELKLANGDCLNYTSWGSKARISALATETNPKAKYIINL